jgi:histidine triad (HIT) family protein
MVEDCLFCGIAEGSIPATKLYEDDGTVAFADLNPQAPTHVLVITKRHFADVVELAVDPEASAALLGGVRATVEQLGLSDFRMLFNTGREAGQTVFHVHAHVLSGRPMAWPPG